MSSKQQQVVASSKLQMASSKRKQQVMSSKQYRVFQKKVCICVFAISWLPRCLEKWFCTFFSSPPCAESKKMCTFILRLILADLQTKQLLDTIKRLDYILYEQQDYIKQLFWHQIRQFLSQDKNITISEFCINWAVGKCKKTFFQASQKLINHNNQSVPKKSRNSCMRSWNP